MGQELGDLSGHMRSFFRVYRAGRNGGGSLLDVDR